MMCCPSSEVIKRDTKRFLYSSYYTIGGLHEDKFYATFYKDWDHCQNSSSNLLTPYREQPRSTRIVVAYPPRPAFSATKRTNYAQINFAPQARVSQGHTSCRNTENRNAEVHCGGGLGLVMSAREPASSRPKPYASLKNTPRILPVRRFLLVLIERKQTMVRDQLFPQKPPGSRL